MVIQSSEKASIMLKIESQFSSETAVQASKKKVKSASTYTSKNKIKKKIKTEIKSEIKEETTDPLHTKLRFKKSSDSLKHMISKIENNEDLPAPKDLFTKLSDLHFQHTPSPLPNCTRAGMRALEAYEKKENRK